MPQIGVFFDDTVRGNVTLGAEWITDDEVGEALRAAQDGFVAALLPEGLDARLGSAARRCRAGSQRICWRGRWYARGC